MKMMILLIGCIIEIVLLVWTFRTEKMDEYEKTFSGWVIGFATGLLIFASIVPVYSKRQNFKVKTKCTPEIKKEILIKTNEEVDTTYYYFFKNSSVEKTD